MPLLDHFHAPIFPRHSWEAFHSNWATRLADALNDRWLPPDYYAEEHTHSGARLEIDVATYEETRDASLPSTNGPPGTTVAAPVWSPPRAQRTMPAVFPDTFEVRVFSTLAGSALVAAIELISPGNKDRVEQRLAFASKCASYLQQGISLVLIDVVTNRRANLHNETMRLLQAAADLDMPAEAELYTVAYRPVRREDKPEIDLWFAPCLVGAELPTMPLRLTADLFVPVEFEPAYEEARRHRRLR